MAGNMLTSVQRLETLAHELRRLREALDYLQQCEDVLYKFENPDVPLTIDIAKINITQEEAVKEHREAARAVLIAAFRIV